MSEPYISRGEYQPIGQNSADAIARGADFQRDYLAEWARMTPGQRAWVGVEASAVRLDALSAQAVTPWAIACALAVACLVLGVLGLRQSMALRKLKTPKP